MKVLIWTDSDCFAGTEKHCLDLSVGLRALGHRVLVGGRSASPLSDFVKKQGGEYLDIPGSSRSLASVALVAGLLRSGAIDVVHAHNGVVCMLACVAVEWAGRGSVVFTEHFIAPARTRRRGLSGRLSRFVHRLMGKRVVRRIAISSAVAQAVENAEGVDPSKIRLVLNGVDGASADEPDAMLARERLSLPQAGLIILCPARLEPEKGHGTLLNALAMLAAEDVDFTAVLIGDGMLREQLEGRIQNLRLQSRMRLLGHQTNPWWWMCASDVVVLPSPEEPFGLVLAEAMSRGIPVVAANSGGPREIVTPESGLLFAAEDGRDLACHLFTLASDSDLRRRLGIGAKQRWNGCFRIDRMATQVADVYAEALACGCS